ncbi:MAG: bifunctional hydroxymethylpyrimidine kinase/phosphomethylpyrimidine kinase [Elusimicrobia bacterium]|nr:bifunctional hydroxymethylpyrimidine kinase/phosphomethylpyrimidine kinase [Elusimicrobiota bacterium]
MDDILVVGSIALDSVKTPEGESVDALGGSAVYFSLSARNFTPVSLVGVVGADFPEAHRKMLTGRGVDISGLKTAAGKTFRWVGKFGKDLDKAKTLDTQLNVFETFKPELGAAHRKASVLFLANIDPDLQWEVLAQMQKPRVVACDTMNFWIGLKLPALKELLSRVDVLFVNEEEAQKLAHTTNNVRAAHALAAMGPRVVVLKKGEHGTLLCAGGKVFPFPAFPVKTVKDPTGAGDTFAGGFMGSLAASGADVKDLGALKRAVAFGSVMASFNVSEFSTRRMETLSRAEVDERFAEYRELLALPDAAVPA